MRNIEFTHYWVTGFGWEFTVFLPLDFEKVEVLGFNDIDGFIFIGINLNKKHIFKGIYK